MVHRSYKFAILTLKNGKHDGNSFKTFFSKKSLSDLQKEDIKLDYPLSLVVDSEPEKYNLITPRSQVELDLYQKIKLKYPALRKTRLFRISNDFHRTNDTKYFKEYQTDDDPLYEGKLIGQFRLVAVPKEGVTQTNAYKRLGDDLNEYRIGYRDISSSTNRRTIIATILPRNAVAANSLFMQINASETTLSARLFYLAMLNSYVLDFVMRKLIDKHVSQTFLKQLPMPPYGQFVYEDDLIQITKELLMLNDNGFEELDSLGLGTNFKGKNYNQLVAELNARIAIGFDLNRYELINLLRTFESVNHKQAVQEEAQRIIEVYDHLKAGEA